MNLYWEEVWRNPDQKLYQGYIEGHIKDHRKFLDVFKEYRVKTVCDAACGFGAYSAILAVNGFTVAGFDVAASSVKLTKELLGQFNINTESYIVSSITDIAFPSEQFDAVIAHAVIDHLSVEDAGKAVNELLRIVRAQGLVYLSFDGLEEDDLTLEHQVLEDGSFLYSDENRKGLLFRYYEDSEIDDLLKDRDIIYRKTGKSGEREVIIRK